MLTALRTLEVMCKSSRSLDELTSDLQVFPQVLVNVKVKQKRSLGEMPSVQREIDSVTDSFGDRGRVLVRFSGTEPLARVMVEGMDREQVQVAADRIAGAIRIELG